MVGIDGRPQAVKNFLAYSLRRLGTDYIDIYRPARLDPAVPIEDTIGAIADMVKAGYVRHIGLSEVGAETIRRAHAVHPIADLQIEYSLMSRGTEAEILPTTRELGIGDHRLWRAVARAPERTRACACYQRRSSRRANAAFPAGQFGKELAPRRGAATDRARRKARPRHSSP